MKEPVWVWDEHRIENLLAAYQGVLEGSSEAPMLYVKMSPQAVLSLMRQEGWHLIDAIVSEPEKATA